MLHYTSFAGRTEINSVFCISVCSSHHAPRKTCSELWKPGVLPKLREITSYSSDPQRVTLFPKIEEPKAWLSLEICLDFQTQEELRVTKLWLLPLLWTLAQDSHNPLSPGQHQPPPPHSCPGKGGNLGCCWPLTPGCRREQENGENWLSAWPLLWSRQQHLSRLIHRNKAWGDNSRIYKQNGTCFLATKLSALWDFMLNGMKKNPICFEAH